MIVLNRCDFRARMLARCMVCRTEACLLPPPGEGSPVWLRMGDPQVGVLFWFCPACNLGLAAAPEAVRQWVRDVARPAIDRAARSVAPELAPTRAGYVPICSHAMAAAWRNRAIEAMVAEAGLQAGFFLTPKGNRG